MKKQGNIALEIKSEIIKGPRGLSIQSLKYKETLPNGDNIYEVIREDNVILGEITAKKGAQGIQGVQGKIGRGIVEVKKVEKIGKTNNWEIKYTDETSDYISIQDGDSAFEVAVENGFTWEWTGEGEEPEDYGEKEWLKSLIGKGLEFNWAGTQLGVRVEGETEYKYSDDLKGEKGDKGDIGKAFYITKVYSSIAEMEADFGSNTVKIGEYVIIQSQDEDNGKLFEKKESGFEFIVKMSGSGGSSEYLKVDENRFKYVLSGNISDEKFETIGSYNVLLGFVGGGRGSWNVAIGGEYTLWSVTTGANNIAIGGRSLTNTTTGSYNVGIAYNALSSNTTGANNIAIGNNSLYSNVTGQDNIAIGEGALVSSKGWQNIGIGSKALSGVQNFDNAIGLGYNTAVTGANQAQIGNSSVVVYCYGAVQNRSDKRDKTDIQDTKLGLNFLMKLKPREYRWDYREDYINQEAKERELEEIENLEITEKEKEKKREEILTRYSLENVEKNGKKKGWRFHQGFVAQEVFETMRELGVDFGGYQDHSINGGKDVLSLGYEEFIPVLVKGIQEQQKEIEELKNKIEKLEGRK